MASMWKPLLAATLAVGRNTRLLTVGSSILAINAPMAAAEMVDSSLSFRLQRFLRLIKVSTGTVQSVLCCNVCEANRL